VAAAVIPSNTWYRPSLVRCRIGDQRQCYWLQALQEGMCAMNKTKILALETWHEGRVRYTTLSHLQETKYLIRAGLYLW
jgi:hypothetical protein